MCAHEHASAAVSALDHKARRAWLTSTPCCCSSSSLACLCTGSPTLSGRYCPRPVCMHCGTQCEGMDATLWHLVEEDVINVLFEIVAARHGHGCIRSLADDLDVPHCIVLQAVQQRLCIVVLRAGIQISGDPVEEGD